MTFSIDSIVERLTQALPTEFHAIKADMEHHFRAILQNALQQMQIVTREEFEIQTQVLRKTREKLEMLEKQIATIEKN